MPAFVHKLRSYINARFRSQQPETVFVDLGNGFYQSGAITMEFKHALRDHGLKPFHGDDASVQPARSGDLWPHETAVSWVRQRLRATLPPEPWHEAESDFEARLKAAAAWVNDHHDAEGLCKQMPRRMHDLVCVARGARLSK